MRILQHDHNATSGAHAHSPLEEYILYGAALLSLGLMAYAYFRYIRPRRRQGKP